MKRQIFINLPVSDLPNAMAFYTAIGLVNNPQFSDDSAACMVVSEEIFVMLMVKERFESFTNKPTADTLKTVSVINSMALENIDAVNAFMDKALAAGGTEPNEAKDYGFMFQRSLTDLDGHYWEVFFMDITKFPPKA